MSEPFLHSLFSLEGKVAVVTGGSGSWVRQWRKVWRKPVRASPFLPDGSNR